MLQNEFLKKISEENYLEILREENEAFIVCNKNNNKKYKLNKLSLESADWDNLLNVLNGREPFVLDGITRIVGYFSKISNWNKSKIGELHDRRQGDYKIN